jgi:TolA-binding protein
LSNRRTFLAAIFAAALAAPAFGAAQRGPLTASVDAELEGFSDHNLDVGRQYYKRKAYAGAKDRLEEILATHPEYTKIDEVYYLLALCLLKMDDEEGARELFKRVLEERPEGPVAKKAKEELDKLAP